MTFLGALIVVLGALIGSIIAVGILYLIAGPPWWFDDGDEDTRL